MERPPTIQTVRLHLLALLPAEIKAIIAGDLDRASRLAGVLFPSGWPDDIELKEGLPLHLHHIKTDAAQIRWRIRAIVERVSNSVVGSINLKGPPNENGDVEIGWGVTTTCRRRGYALEAAKAVLDWVRDERCVKTVSATIPDDNSPSQKLAAKLGMIRTDELRRHLPLWRIPLS